MIALNSITSEWFDIGLHLRVKYGALKEIEADYRKVRQCMREMLVSWLKGQGGECTKHTLRTALSNINCRIVDKITVSDEYIMNTAHYLFTNYYDPAVTISHTLLICFSFHYRIQISHNMLQVSYERMLCLSL